MNAIVIVPTYNERDNLTSLIPAILEVDGALDILIVDDGSPDGTGELAESLAMRTDRVRVLQRGSKQGLGTAYIDGFRYALSQGYDYMIRTPKRTGQAGWTAASERGAASSTTRTWRGGRTHPRGSPTIRATAQAVNRKVVWHR